MTCLHCKVGEPSVWDSVLWCWAHPANEPGKFKVCEEPWAERQKSCDCGLPIDHRGFHVYPVNAQGASI